MCASIRVWGSASGGPVNRNDLDVGGGCRTNSETGSGCPVAGCVEREPEVEPCLPYGYRTSGVTVNRTIGTFTEPTEPDGSPGIVPAQPRW